MQWDIKKITKTTFNYAVSLCEGKNFHHCHRRVVDEGFCQCFFFLIEVFFYVEEFTFFANEFAKYTKKKLTNFLFKNMYFFFSIIHQQKKRIVYEGNQWEREREVEAGGGEKKIKESF